MDPKYYFFSYWTKHLDMEPIQGCGVTDEHPFKTLQRNSNDKRDYELISYREITREEYNLWYELDLD